MGKKAYLVWSVVGTRVVADEDATDEEIYNLAHKSLVENLDDSGYELCEDIFEDTEVQTENGPVTRHKVAPVRLPLPFHCLVHAARVRIVSNDFNEEENV